MAMGAKFTTNNAHNYSIQLDVNNVFGKEYMSVAYRAMPSTSFNVSIRYHLKKSN
jgi:outer membrane receptor protein involved in Fe transport